MHDAQCDPEMSFDHIHDGFGELHAFNYAHTAARGPLARLRALGDQQPGAWPKCRNVRSVADTLLITSMADKIISSLEVGACSVVLGALGAQQVVFRLAFVVVQRALLNSCGQVLHSARLGRFVCVSSMSLRECVPS